MNKTLAEAAVFIDELAEFPIPVGVQPFVLPPHTALASVRDRLPADSPILLGAQNAHWDTEGALTGEISMRMAADAGATMVEIGHSERREHFGETDQTVAAKAAAAVEHGLIPLICVGEPAKVRRAGDTEAYVAGQVRAAVSRLAPADVAGVLVAYEPVWSIGEHGRAARRHEVAPVTALISAILTEIAPGPPVVLYGGGVDTGNAADLLNDPHADGLFVGRAGWTAAGFVELLELGGALARHGSPYERPHPHRKVLRSI